MVLLEMLGENVHSGSNEEERQGRHDKVTTKMTAATTMIAVTMRRTTKKAVAGAVTTVVKIRVVTLASGDGAQGTALMVLMSIPCARRCSQDFT